MVIKAGKKLPHMAAFNYFQIICTTVQSISSIFHTLIERKQFQGDDVILTMKGQHLIIDAFSCNSEILNNKILLEKLLKDAALKAEMEVLFSYFHQFQPQGITGILVLSTSHISIHTWPEKEYASLDFYTCGEHDLLTQVDFLLNGLSSKNALVYNFTRGVSNPQLIKCIEISLTNPNC